MAIKKTCGGGTFLQLKHFRNNIFITTPPPLIITLIIIILFYNINGENLYTGTLRNMELQPSGGMYTDFFLSKEMKPLFLSVIQMCDVSTPSVVNGRNRPTYN